MNSCYSNFPPPLPPFSGLLWSSSSGSAFPFLTPSFSDDHPAQICFPFGSATAPPRVFFELCRLPQVCEPVQSVSYFCEPAEVFLFLLLGRAFPSRPSFCSFLHSYLPISLSGPNFSASGAPQSLFRPREELLMTRPNPYTPLFYLYV